MTRSAARRPRFNLVADHMTLLLEPELYKPFYAVSRIVFGVPPEGIVYEKRRRWPGARADSSMTFATDLGDAFKEKGVRLARTMLAVVQPTEPRGQRSHVREMLRQHQAAAHLQHIALRTPDLFAFHEHARARGVNFITPILRERDEDLLQVFSGELYAPGGRPTGLFFEFVQRAITRRTLELLKRQDRQSFFKDRTFLGLYAEKEREYQSGFVTPLIDHELMRAIQESLSKLELWQIREPDVDRVERLMLDYAAAKGDGRRAPTAAR
ncbi:MAG: hypothetical protein HY554_07935 [Elusimicrobia bacterium]|nr:hypothetical protein [Elusimicrobiota bacterium]